MLSTNITQQKEKNSLTSWIDFLYFETPALLARPWCIVKSTMGLLDMLSSKDGPWQWQRQGVMAGWAFDNGCGQRRWCLTVVLDGGI
jgi:hypothetical protein